MVTGSRAKRSNQYFAVKPAMYAVPQAVMVSLSMVATSTGSSKGSATRPADMSR